jgi:hypothetical protein
MYAYPQASLSEHCWFVSWSLTKSGDPMHYLYTGPDPLEDSGKVSFQRVYAQCAR